MPDIRTSELNIGFLESGPRDGSPVLLLHGFPADATSWSAVMEQMSTRGYRCVAPFLRGVGPTTFLDVETPRASEWRIGAWIVSASMVHKDDVGSRGSRRGAWPTRSIPPACPTAHSGFWGTSRRSRSPYCWPLRCGRVSARARHSSL